jgi:hypothetical protein
MIAMQLQMMCQEPWCFTPAQVAELTDWQIEHLYYRPAIERAQKLESDIAKTNPNAVTPVGRGDGLPTDEELKHPPIGTPAFKDFIVRKFQAFGMSYDKAVKMYEAQAKQYKPSK